tara:strand:+ start:3012 stop:3404 length:393 start_codon:yes stop_codon:yes gene_type:complete
MSERRLKYVNAYSVTRHYGGPEEGGWWYNRGYPLASVPVVIGPPPPWVPEWWGKKADGSCAYPDGGHIERYPEMSEADESALKSKVAELEALFDDVAEGDISSVLGGTEVYVQWEDESASPWPEETPYYC